jgi:hypothetical protein
MDIRILDGVEKKKKMMKTDCDVIKDLKKM